MLSQTTLYTVAALIAATVSAGDKKCRALVLSGGGTNGAWEAGVIWGLTHYGDPTDYYYDVHTGVSAGSVNTIGQIGFEPSEAVEAAEYLSDSWANVVNSQVYREWGDDHGVLGLAKSCLTNISCFDTSPMLQWLTDQLNQFASVKRRFTVSAVDINDGEYVIFNQTNTAFEEIPQAALSSSSIPGAFPPQHFKGHLLMDGGTVWDVNPISAVQQCLEIVDDVKDIIIDVALCSPHDNPDEEKHDQHDAIYELLRGRNVKQFYTGSNAIADAKLEYPEADWRYLFTQKDPLSVCIDFRNETTWPLQIQGRQDAQDQLNAREKGFEGFKLLEDWNEDKEGINEEHASFADYFKAKLDQILGN